MLYSAGPFQIELDSGLLRISLESHPSGRWWGPVGSHLLLSESLVLLSSFVIPQAQKLRDLDGANRMEG